MTSKTYKKSSLINAHKRGSATMEYVVVSTFAALLSIAAITFVKDLVKTRIDDMTARLGTDAPQFELSF